MTRGGTPLLLLLWCSAAWATPGDSERARQHFIAGKDLFQHGRAADALVEFEAGRALSPLPEFDFNIGLCLAALKRPGEAADALQRFIDAKPDDPEAREIWKMIAELRREEAHQRTKPPTPEARTPAAAAAPPPRAHDDRRRVTLTRAAIATSVIGGTMLLAGALTGGGALGMRNDYDNGCDLNRCDQSVYDSAMNFAIATDVLLPVGAALVVTSIVLFAVRPRAAPRVSLAGVSV